MYMRYYDSYPALAVQQKETNEVIAQDAVKDEQVVEIKDEAPISIASKGGFLSSVKADDIILIALIFILLSESEDIIMLLIVGYLLLGDKLNI